MPFDWIMRNFEKWGLKMTNLMSHVSIFDFEGANMQILVRKQDFLQAFSQKDKEKSQKLMWVGYFFC